MVICFTTSISFCGHFDSSVADVWSRPSYTHTILARLLWQYMASLIVPVQQMSVWTFFGFAHCKVMSASKNCPLLYWCGFMSASKIYPCCARVCPSTASHAPTVVLSCHVIIWPQRGLAIDTQFRFVRQVQRDPRFDDLSGQFNETIFNQTYGFLSGIKQREKEVKICCISGVLGTKRETRLTMSLFALKEISQFSIGVSSTTQGFKIKSVCEKISGRSHRNEQLELFRSDKSFLHELLLLCSFHRKCSSSWKKKKIQTKGRNCSLC